MSEPLFKAEDLDRIEPTQEWWDQPKMLAGINTLHEARCPYKQVMVLKTENARLREVIKAFTAYDDAILLCTRNGQFVRLPNGGAIATGDDLDALYDKCFSLARAALEGKS